MERPRPGKAEVDMDPFSDYLESEEVYFCFKWCKHMLVRGWSNKTEKSSSVEPNCGFFKNWLNSQTKKEKEIQNHGIRRFRIIQSKQQKKENI